MANGAVRRVVAVGLGAAAGVIAVRALLRLASERHQYAAACASDAEGMMSPEAVTRPSPACSCRCGALASVVQRWWTLPTTLVGRAVARVLSASPPARVSSDLATGYLCELPESSYAGLSGCVTLGDVIVCTSGAVRGPNGQLLLAHELAHVRQHQLLGPLYLLMHASAQVLSMMLHQIRPTEGISRVHSRNPLEEQLIAVPYSTLHRSSTSHHIAERAAERVEA